MRSDMSVVIAKDTHKSYPLDGTRLKILKGINLELEKGTIVALMGPSGSGKSTLLNILGTLDKPDSGSVLLNGHDVKNFTDAQLTDVKAWKKFFLEMLKQGIYLAPSAFEAMFISLAHNKEDIEKTIDAARISFAKIANEQ